MSPRVLLLAVGTALAPVAVHAQAATTPHEMHRRHADPTVVRTVLADPDDPLLPDASVDRVVTRSTRAPPGCQ